MFKIKMLFAGLLLVIAMAIGATAEKDTSVQVKPCSVIDINCVMADAKVKD